MDRNIKVPGFGQETREDVIHNVQIRRKRERYWKALPLTEFSASSKKAGLVR